MVKIDFSNNSEPAINDTNLNQMQLNIENAINSQVSGDTLPVGSIVAYSSTTIPTNWLLCDGRAISRTEYALLFSIIGTAFGVGDGSTTFNLPNLKGRVPVGVDSSQTEFDTLGETGGEKTHTLTVDEMPSHNHQVARATSGQDGGSDWNIQNASTGIAQWYTTSTGGGQPHNILQPYQTTNYIIKAFSSAGLVANVANGYSTSQNDTYSCDYVNKKTIRKIATVALESSVEMTSGIIPLSRIVYATVHAPEGLTFYNNGIKIGAGISKILVSANIFAETTNYNDYLWTRIQKNGLEASAAIAPYICGYVTTSHSPLLLSVSEGDVINLYKIDNTSATVRGNITNTFMTVEVVE